MEGQESKPTPVKIKVRRLEAKQQLIMNNKQQRITNFVKKENHLRLRKAERGGERMRKRNLRHKQHKNRGP